MANPASADRLYFTDEESLVGTLVGIADAKVIWASPYLGELYIDQHQVARLETAGHYDLKMSGEELSNCWMFVQRQKQHLHCDQGVQVLNSWKLVVAAGETVTQPLPLLSAQRGNIRVAMEDSSGNTDFTKYDIESRTEIRFIESRHTIAFLYLEESAESQTTRNMWNTSYQYDQFLTQKWFATGNGFYQEDEFREIDQRASVGLGMGYQFLETYYVSLLAKTTINYLDEQFSNGTSRETPAALWNLEFVWRFNEEGMEFYHRHGFLQAFESSEDFEFNLLTGFKYPINGQFSSTLQWEYTYDNSPAEAQVDKKDQKWSLGVNYDW